MDIIIRLIDQHPVAAWCIGTLTTAGAVTWFSAVLWTLQRLDEADEDGGLH